MEAGKAALLANLVAMDQCIADVTRKVNEVMQVIWQYGQTTIAELTEEKRKLEENIQRSIAEVEGSLYEDTPNLQEPLSGLLREYEEAERGSLQLFAYAISPQEVPTPLSSLLAYTLTATLANALVRLYKNSLLTLDVCTGIKREFRLSASVSEIYRYCLVSKASLIAVGGMKAISISLNNADVTQLQPPKVEHAHPGVIAVAQEVYVFGGNYPNCEKLSRDLVWSNLPSMNKARHSFSPCLYRGEIYLASYESLDIEVFSLKTASFRVLPVRFPANSNNSTSFIIGDLLTIITCNKQLAELDLGAGTGFSVTALPLREITNILHSHPPVAIGKKVYWFSAFTGDLITYDLQAKTLQEESITLS